MPSLRRIGSTPVKGTALRHPNAVHLDEAGIAGNRRFYLIGDDGLLFTVFDLTSLVQVATDIDATTGILRCAFPSGSTVEGPTDDLGDAVRTDFDGREVAGRVVQGPFAEAFSTYAGRPLRLARTDRDGDGPDVEPLTVISIASVDDLARRGGHPGDLDTRRFRMNLELDGCEPYEEDSWAGREVAVGEAIIRIVGQVPRCRVTNHSPLTGEADFPTLKTVASYRQRISPDKGIPFGMYARVERPGLAHVGDAVLPAG